MSDLHSHPVIFKSYGSKFYAETPLGELAFGDQQGLYEWRGGVRIHHTGADRQISSAGRMHTWSAAPQPHNPVSRGFAAALSARRVN